jgi:hypothetical protein
LRALSKGQKLPARRIAERPLARTATLIHLKLFQRMGYFVRLVDVPKAIRERIAAHA